MAVTVESKGSVSKSPPKYVALAEHLRREIEQGSLAPGDRLPSFAEMRSAHGVTPTTIERVHKVLEADGLIIRRHGSGIYVAPPRRKTATGLIGFLHSGFARQSGVHRIYWANLLEGVQNEASRHGLQIALIDDQTPENGWEKIDGVVMTEVDWRVARGRVPLPMPCVSLLHEADMPSVVMDETGGIREAMEHLVSLGHRRIAALPAYENSHRVACYRQSLQEAGIAWQPAWQRPLHEGGFDKNLDFTGHAYQAMTQWLREDWKELGLTALMAQNDEAALGAMAALREAGLKIGEDVSVVGFDGAGVDLHSSPHLTTIRAPLQEMGAAGLNLLLQQIEGGRDVPEKIVLPTSLKVGGTTVPTT